MTTPTFSVLVVCIGRASLRRTLESFLAQELVEGDELHLVINPDEPECDASFIARQSTQAQIRSYPATIVVHACDQIGYYNKWNWAMYNVRHNASHVLPMMGDDDIFRKGAFTKLRAACAPDPQRPVLFRFLSPLRFVLWDEPRMQMSRISGHCIAVPIEFFDDMPASTRDYKEADYDWMLNVLTKAKYLGYNDPLWLDEMLIVARPDEVTDAQGLV